MVRSAVSSCIYMYIWLRQQTSATVNKYKCTGRCCTLSCACNKNKWSISLLFHKEQCPNIVNTQHTLPSHNRTTFLKLTTPDIVLSPEMAEVYRELSSEQYIENAFEVSWRSTVCTGTRFRYLFLNGNTRNFASAFFYETMWHSLAIETTRYRPQCRLHLPWSQTTVPSLTGSQSV